MTFLVLLFENNVSSQPSTVNFLADSFSNLAESSSVEQAYARQLPMVYEK